MLLGRLPIRHIDLGCAPGEGAVIRPEPWRHLLDPVVEAGDGRMVLASPPRALQDSNL